MPTPPSEVAGAPADDGVAASQAALGLSQTPEMGPKQSGGPNEGGGATGPAANPLALRHERLQGIISKYVPSSGWGFVRSDSFEGELGFKTEGIMLEFQSYDFKESEGVEFDVQADERGRPQAAALKPVIGRKPSECIGQRLCGYVRRFADRWGFLNAAAFDGDLFVHRDNLLLGPEQAQDGQPPLRAGQQVEFDVALDDRGRTVAKQITTSALPRPCDWIGRRLHGYIRSFQGAWGFINSDRFAGDLFLHSDSVLSQYQGIELTAGTMVEFDVERDHHRKGGKNRLVARQVAVVQPAAGGQVPGGAPYYNQGHMDQMGGYGNMPSHQMPGHFGGSSLNPQANTFAPAQTSPMYYPGVPNMPHVDGVQPQLYQPPYPYDPSQFAAQPGLPPHPLVPPAYGQHMLPGATPYAGLPQPPLPGSPGTGLATQVQGLPPQPILPGQPGQYPGQPQPLPVVTPAVAPDGNRTGVAPQAGTGGGEQPQVLLHITTHDWEPDQSGQLRVRKGTLVNVSHRAAHGWVYAATVQPGGGDGEPAGEGWVPQAVAKRVSLCRVVVDWPAEGSGTLGLQKGDLIAVSKEAERGWVYGERISPKRAEQHGEGWLPKKVLEYILM